MALQPLGPPLASSTPRPGCQTPGSSAAPSRLTMLFLLNQPETTLEVSLFLPQALSFIITEKLRDSFWLNTPWNIQDPHAGLGPPSATFIFLKWPSPPPANVPLSEDIWIQHQRLSLSRQAPKGSCDDIIRPPL